MGIYFANEDIFDIFSMNYRYMFWLEFCEFSFPILSYFTSKKWNVLFIHCVIWLKRNDLCFWDTPIYDNSIKEANPVSLSFSCSKLSQHFPKSKISDITDKVRISYRIPSNLVRPLIRADGPFFENWTNFFSLIISTGTVLRIFIFLLIPIFFVDSIALYCKFLQWF